MPKLETLHDLMIHQMHDIYSAEKQLVQALPLMAKKASSQELRAAFSSHLDETEEHVSRLEQAFDLLGVKARAQKCKGMEGLIEEGKEWLEEDVDPEVLDAGLIAAAQRMEHYEIAAYGTVREYARIMGHSDLVGLMESTLTEEKGADNKLTKLAATGINAMVPAMDGTDNGNEPGDDDEEESGVMAKRGRRSSKSGSSR